MIFKILLLLVVVLSSDAKSAPSLRETQFNGCLVGGYEVPVGHKVILTEECRECDCVSDDNAECKTIEQCEGCWVKGTYYEPGEEFIYDMCSYCTCEGGYYNAVSCLLDTCPEENDVEIKKKSLGYWMGLSHAKLEENRRKKNRNNKNKRQNENDIAVAGCDLVDEWLDVGDSWGDGCNEPYCECTYTGEVVCSMQSGCTGEGGCVYRGQYVAVGDTIPDPSGCGGCTCHDDGLIYCTQMLDCNSCFVGETKYAVGDEVPSGDSCNTCTCMYGGGIACTLMACNENEIPVHFD